jgi:two-component system phosphate regulon response regulator PhoB
MRTPARPRILVVEDDEATRTLLELILIEDGHRVITATSGEEALRLIEQEAFDLILTDHRLPGISGATLVRRIREHRRLRSMPILLATGMAGDPELEGLDVQGRLSKPFDLRTLLGFVRALADRALPRPAGRVPAAALTRSGAA